MRWITVKNTHAPGRVYQSLNSNARTYTVEDTYIKAWIPVVLKSRFALAIGPHYRSERLELKRTPDDVDELAAWQLQAIGVDIKSGFALLALLAATASSDAKLSQSLAGSTIAFPEVS